MSAIPVLTDEECYLAALLEDETGIDLAELTWVDEEQPDRCYRVWDFQWPLYHCNDVYQIDQMARGLGKSVGIVMRAFAFPLVHPGAEMLITAPELNHLRLITDKVENLLLYTRLGQALRPPTKGGGINHQPQFQCTFINGARIFSRLPNKTGRGVKGCIAEGTLVLTRQGQKPIEQIAIGDEVWTHEGRWKPVTWVVEANDVEGYEVAGGGHRGLQMSVNHRQFVRTPVSGSKEKRRLGGVRVAIADQLTTDDFLGSPTRFEAELVPTWMTEEMAWVAGRWVADGHAVFQMKGGKWTCGRLMFTVKTDRKDALADQMRAAGLRPGGGRARHNDSVILEACDTTLARAFKEEFGYLADGKHLAPWLLGASEEVRRAFLDGYLSGDGHWDEKRGRWTAGTASRALAVDLRLLGQTLGYSTSLSWVDPHITNIDGRRLKAVPKRSYRVTFTHSGYSIVERHAAWQRIRRITPMVLPRVFDLTVADDGSFLADGTITHNVHPLVIEQDEGQDYPEPGYVELIETMKTASPGAQWRIHGVSRGVRDFYYRLTMGENPDLPFYVHRYIAAHRPSWGSEERRSKIAIYGGTEENVDYRRNIFGEHGDAHNPLFVLARLMACVRMSESAWATTYNEDVYTCIKINDELHRKSGLPIESFVDLPGSHLVDEYTSFWAGMDVGFTNDPTEILVFGVIAKRGKPDLHRLLTRIQLQRIGVEDQVKVCLEVFRYYGHRLRRFGMDKTGNGLPLWQLLMNRPAISDRVAGYGFSEKKAVAFDDRAPVGNEKPEDLVIEKNVITWATDELRKYVDTGALELPYDVELLTEWQGQSVVTIKDTASVDGTRKSYAGGKCHTLDAGRMFAAAKGLEGIEKILQKKRPGPVLDQFLGA